MRVLCTGGCGYKGSVLVPKLLNAGHSVVVFDLQWFGSYLQDHPKLLVIKADFREATCEGVDAIIHLAGIANDPAGELNPKVTWETNVLGTMELADKAARWGVPQFIYASSGSVYGVSNAPEVFEEEPLVPLTEYNKSKMIAERVLLSYAQRMGVQIIRPASVCGYSPRMRLDITTNRFVMEAWNTGVIKLTGEDQFRPLIHIDDITDLYLWLLERPYLTGIWNAGFENIQIRRIAQMVVMRIDARLEPCRSSDLRSYRMNSDKLLAAGFTPKKTISDAIDEMADKCKNGQLKDNPKWHSLKSMPKAA